MIKTKVVHEQTVESVVAKMKPAKLTAISKKAVRSGGKIYRTAAKARAPVRTKTLETSLSTKVAKPRKVKAGAYAVTGPRRRYERVMKKGPYKGKPIKPTKYSHLVRKGTKPHYVYKGARRKGGGLPFPNPAKPPTMHPGAKAYDFMGIAQRATQGQVDREVLRVFGKEIGKIMYKPKKKRK